MRISLLVMPVFLLVSLTVAVAQEVEIFGYYEPQYMGINVNDAYSQLFSNKLRIDFQSSAIDRVMFGANLNYLNYQGRTHWNLLEYLPENIAGTAPAGADSLFGFDYSDSLVLDNAFARMSFSIFDLTLGKQQISVGTGYAWNPTDLYNIKDVLDPTYEQTGHTAIRLDAALSPGYNAFVMIFPEADWHESGKLIRLKGKLSHFDYSVIYAERTWQLTDFIGLNTLVAKRRLYGADLAGELLGPGVWGEFGYNTLNDHNDFWEILLGTDYTFDSGFYIMAEYLRNELAKSDYRQFSINDWLRFFTAENRTLARDNLYVYMDYPLTDLIHVSNSLVASLSDKSFALVPSIQYSIYQNVEMNAFLNFNFGDNGRTYSSDQGYGIIARLRIYF